MRKVRSAERKHRGWPVSNGEAETERKERARERDGIWDAASRV